LALRFVRDLFVSRVKGVGQLSKIYRSWMDFKTKPKKIEMDDIEGKLHFKQI
jgi:hypothetical protein